MKKKCLLKKQRFLTVLLAFFLLIPLGAVAQDIQIKGRVLEASSNEGIPGATVMVKGSGTGAITDLDGNYTIKADKNATLVFSFIGYAEQTIAVKGRTQIDVFLKDDNQLLEEVVVVAYGTKSKATVTGALSSIETKELVKSPVASITNSLAGAVPGVSAVQTSGQPGKDGAEIYVRGSGSLSDVAGKPLILVDGVERDFTQLDPNEIESISILKDASSTAVFGVRGANGVVLVTTRRGTSGKPSISVTANFALQQPVEMVEQVGSYEYAKFFNMKMEMSGMPARFSKEAIEAYRTGSDPIFRPNTNWADYMLNDVSIQSKNNINISGGSDNVKYFVSMGYLYQNGILKKIEGLPYDNNYRFQRYNYRANLDVKLTNTTTMKLGIGGHISKNQQPNNTAAEMWNVIQIWATPMAGPGFINGVRTLVPKNSLPDGLELKDGYQAFWGSGFKSDYKTQLNMDVEVSQKLDFITKGLSVAVKGAYDNNFTINKNRLGGNKEYQTAYHKTFLTNPAIPETSVDYDKTIVFVPTGQDSPLTYSEGSARDRNWYLEARVNYDRTFNSDHKVGALFLYNQSRDYYPKKTDGSNAQYVYMPRGYIGFVGRATYAYRTKYLFDVNVGYNGSENFAPGKNRYGLFPSVSAGWVVTAEKFMENQHIVDYLKLRASYGKVGSDVGTQTRFMYKPGSWSPGGSYSFGVDNPNSLPAYGYGIPGNSDVSWETAKKQNYGLDAKFINERLSVNFDYFFEHRTGILVAPNSFPGIIGTGLPNMNIGIVDNHGYEISVGWKDTFRNDFNYYVNANMSFAKNKIIYMDEVKHPYDYQDVTGGSTGRNGNLYKFIRLYQESDFVDDGKGNKILNPNLPQPEQLVAPGDCMFSDLNNDNVVNDLDRGIFGYSKRPEYTFGLNAGFDYKGFNFSMQWVGATHVDKLLYVDYIIPFTNQGGRGLLKHLYEGCWTPENTNGKYPRPAEQTESWNYGSAGAPTSTLFLQDASYIRLKSLNVGYTFRNKPILKKLGLNAVTLSFSGYNLLTFSPMKLADPESTTNNQGEYPLCRLYSFGLNLNF